MHTQQHGTKLQHNVHPRIGWILSPLQCVGIVMLAYEEGLQNKKHIYIYIYLYFLLSLYIDVGVSTRHMIV